MRKEHITVTNNSVCNSAENKVLEGKGMKSRFVHFKKRMVPALSGALMGVMLMSITCFAAGTGTSAVTQPLENLKTHRVFQVLKDPDYCAARCDCLFHDGRKQDGQSYNGYLLQIFSFMCI